MQSPFTFNYFSATQSNLSLQSISEDLIACVVEKYQQYRLK